MAESVGNGVQAVRRRRRELQSAIDGLEDALARASGRPDQWCEGVRRAVANFREILDEHVAATEGEGGLFQQLLDEEPRLDAWMNRLRREHTTLAEHASALARRCGDGPRDAAGIDEIREHSLAVLAAAARHRQQGADLVWEAYQVDVSVGD